MYSRDTLRTVRDLEDAGLERRQAEAIASAIAQADKQAAAKADITALKTDIAALRSEFRWVFSFLAALLFGVIARLFAVG